MFLRRPGWISQHAHRCRSRLSTPHTIEPLEERRMMAPVAVPYFPGQTEALQVERLIVPGDDDGDSAIDTRSQPDHLAVRFYQMLDSTGGATGVHSASNPANWQLLFGDTDVSHLISHIEVNGETATLRLQSPLSAGAYRLRLGDNLQSSSGLAIRDLDADTPYASDLPTFHVLPFLETAPTSSISGNHNGPQVSLYRLQVDGQGNYAVLFQRYEFDADSGLQASVRIQRFSSVGEKVGSEILISTEKFAGPADFAMNASGEFIVSWRRPGVEADRLSVRRFNSSGGSIGSVITIDVPRNGWSTFKVAIDDAGRAVFVWTTPDLTGERVWAQRIAADGTREGEAILVGLGANPLLVKNAAGDFTIAWTTADVGIFAQHFNDSGTLRGERIRVDAISAQERLMDLDVDPAGGVTITTVRMESGISEARLRRYDAQGQLREPPRTLLADRSASLAFVELSLAPDGHRIMHWGETHWSQSDFPLTRSYAIQYATIFDTNGREISSPFLTEEGFVIGAGGHIVSVQDRKLITAITNDTSWTANPSPELPLPISSKLIAYSPSADGIFMRHLRLADLTIVDLNGDPPGVNIKRNFVPGGSPALLADPGALEIHAASPTIASAKITIEGYQPGDTLLTYSLNYKILWSFNAGVLTLTGVDTVAAYESLLNDIWFKTTANRAAGSKVNIRVVVNDGAGESAPAYSFISIHVPGRSSIAGRHLFYNNSSFDGSSPAANAADDMAIATDKSAMLPGQTATKNNVTNYTRGINGIMVDLAGSHGTIEVDDFIFRTGNSSDPSGWANAPTPSSIVVRPAAGVGGADRVVITWADGAIANTWLQVIVLDNGDTGLAAPDIFYFGNRVGDTGNESHRAQPQSTEALQIINRLRGAGGGVDAAITDPLDIDRNGRINSQDMLAMFNAIRAQKEPLNMIRAPGGQSGLNGAIITGGLFIEWVQPKLQTATVTLAAAFQSSTQPTAAALNALHSESEPLLVRLPSTIPLLLEEPDGL